MNDRDLDVVVLGATGITGRYVAAYLAERQASSGARWAAAARDGDKATRVLAQCGVEGAETIVADVADPGSLRSLVARARVVLDLVGPYTLHGRPVIEACVAGGAHYVDLTGEIPFVARTIEEFDAAAKAAGVKVVQVCGFEALPPDLSVLLAAEAARERWGEGLASVELVASITPPPGPPRPSDMISGGTLQSLLAVAAAEGAETIADPAALLTDPAAVAAVRRVSPIAIGARVSRSGGVVAPMAPAPFINPAVIHRTAALGDAAAGRPASPFRYREGMLIPGARAALPLRAGIAGAMAGTQLALRGFARARLPLRRRVAETLARLGPGSGYGPTGVRMEAWRWHMRTDATTTSGRRLRVEVEGRGHPGYLSTPRMLGEVGLMLAEDGATPALAGCLTPALALGSGGVERLAHAGVKFSVDS